MLRHSGPRAELNNLTGIAAILSYPLDIEQVEEEEKQAREAAQAQVDSDANQDEG
jgi:protein pelota